MNYRLNRFYQVLLCSILTFYVEFSMGRPLNPEDVAGLLPEAPSNTNETMEAIVQDPVIKDAVHYAASNGSLNGLAVKKKVFIMPASDPNKVLSQREEILVVPTEHLEDIRRNISESREVEINESSSETLLEYYEFSEFTTEKGESQAPYISTELKVPGDSKIDDDKLEIEFPEGTVTRKLTLPEDSSKKVSVPIVAVIDPSNLVDEKVNASIVALLPTPINNNDFKDEIDYLKGNRNRIEKETQNYIDQESIAVDPETWNFHTTLPEVTGTTSASQGPSNMQNEQATSVIVPRVGIVTPLFRPMNEHTEDRRDVEDMDVAEDIIFRPLFRYRQEAQRRSKYREELNNYRRSSYQRYNSYQNDDYSRRNRYRPQSNYDYY